VGGGRSNFGANSEAYSIGVGYTQARVNSGQVYYIGATDSATPALLFSNAAGTETARIDNSGNVGIGTSSSIDGGKLSISAGAVPAVAVSGANFTGYSLRATGTNGRQYFISTTDAANGLGAGLLNFYDQTANANRMCIDASGNVGIGINSPTQKLDVQAGSVSAANDATALRLCQPGDGGVAMLFTNGVSNLVRLAGTVTSSGAGTDDGVFTIQTASNGTLAERARIDSSGTLILNQGQIQFPATQVPSGNANTLDDYEEGSWTPVSLTANVSVSNIYGTGYTKIGRQVTAYCYIGVTNNAGAGASWNCGGLPYANAVSYGPAFRYYGPNSFNGSCYVEGSSTFIIDNNGLPAGFSGYMLSATYFTA
jgi:hypothetical protein